jgi:hypothetical protein
MICCNDVWFEQVHPSSLLLLRLLLQHLTSKSLTNQHQEAGSEVSLVRAAYNICSDLHAQSMQ